MELLIRFLSWIIKWMIVIKHLPKVCYQEIKIWISKRREKSLDQIENEFNRDVEEEVSRISTPEKIIIADNVEEYLNKNELNPIILTGDSYRVRRIDNEEGARFFGAEKGWCTADPKANYYRNYYYKDNGDLFIIYKLKKKRPESQLFVTKSGRTEFMFKYGQNKQIKWLEFKDSDQKLKDWWNVYYPAFMESCRESIEVNGSSIIIPAGTEFSAGLNPNDLATLSLLGGYGGAAYGNTLGGLFGGGLEAQAHADGAALQADHARYADMARYAAQESIRSLDYERRMAAQMDNQRMALISDERSQFSRFLGSVDP